MTDPATRANAALGDMESDIFDIRRWGDLVSHLGIEGELPDKESVYVIGAAISALGDRLEKRWHAAIQADRERRLQCA